LTTEPIDLDSQRGMAEQKATQLRRLLAEVLGNEASLRARHEELERQLLAARAENWREAAEKARYLLEILAASPAGIDPRRKALISAVLADFDRLEAGPS
jgi:hypothetical protein